MLILAIDTSTRSGSVALMREEVLVGCMTTPANERYSFSLSSTSELLIKSAGVIMSEIDLFAVASGPGSFTGLRVGLTAVKAWAEVFGKPVAAVSGLEALAAQAFSQEVTSGCVLMAPFMDAHRGQVFGGMYRYSSEDSVMLASVAPEVVAGPAEFVESVRQQAGGEGALFVSPTPEAIRAALAQSDLRECEVRQVSGVLAPTVGRLGYGKARRGDLLDALRLDANYVRRTDAELHLKR
jgi:tRNA threonylcarbamoyladenosine biosynthesis protein TsaB